jgi:hypothetical protein
MPAALIPSSTDPAKERVLQADLESARIASEMSPEYDEDDGHCRPVAGWLQTDAQPNAVVVRSMRHNLTALVMRNPGITAERVWQVLRVMTPMSIARVLDQLVDAGVLAARAFPTRPDQTPLGGGRGGAAAPVAAVPSLFSRPQDTMPSLKVAQPQLSRSSGQHHLPLLQVAYFAQGHALFEVASFD